MRISEGSPTKGITNSITSGITKGFPLQAMTASSGSSDDDSLSSQATFSIEDCVYRGEGNANIVIALPREHEVIRFRKSLPEEVSPDGGKRRVEREVEFVRNVVSWFLGFYAQIPKILRYDTKDIARLSEVIRALRPEKRRHKEITEVYATKFPDYTFLRAKLDPDLFRNKSTYCVEIKPKQGYLTKSEQKFQKCPYCLTQYYKLKKGVIPSRSNYCPFDLFSGTQERMKSAIKGLLESPQNNLKIFNDGIVVYDAESSQSDLECVLAEWFRNTEASTKEGYIDKFSELVCAALLRPFPQDQPKQDTSLRYNLPVSTHQEVASRPSINPDLIAKTKKILYFAGEGCNFETGGLPKDSVLERILGMQRLPYISTEYIYNTYSRLSKVLTDEVVYLNLLKPHRLQDCWILSYTRTNNVTDHVESLNDTYSRLSTKIGAKKQRMNCDSDDSNGNMHISLESPRVGSNETTGNASPMSKSTLLATYFEQNNLYNHKDTITCNQGDDVDYNEQNSSSVITTECLLALQNYLLFSTARDCSILMSFQELNLNAASSIPYDGVIKLSEDLSFLCNIGVSDLDPKSIHCIKKHRLRDIDVLNSVISVLEEELAMQTQS